MKLLFLAAAAAIAIPAAAQTTPDPATQDQATMPTDDSAMDQTTPTEQTAPTTPPMDQTAPTTPDQTTTTPAPATPMAAAPTADAQDPAGGYEPSAPPMNGTPQPGANVVFQPSASKSEEPPSELQPLMPTSYD